MKATKKDAYKLFHDGTLALAEIEGNGIRVDIDYLNTKIEKTDKKIVRLQNRLKADKVFKTWRRRYGGKTNLGSREQLGEIIFTELGYKCSEYTKGGRPKADEHTLASVDLQFVKDYLLIEKLKKANGTYLKGIRREVCNGYLHPSFSLGLARTYRSSSQDPNFQNIPIRNPEISKLIRNCFIPRLPDRHLVEIDYGGIEVKIAACYNKDPMMIRYIKDPKSDMHRDMAAQIFMMKNEQVSKLTRYIAKNMFVFPEFYGSYHVDVAKNLWEGIDRLKPTIEGSDLSVRDHLTKKGLKKRGACKHGEKPMPGTFESHIQKVEHDFWNNHFRVYNDWKKTWYQKYLERGYFDMLTGFRVDGWHKRNDVTNYPVQGAAFHCLLKSLIELQNWLNSRDMGALIVGQIHDSIIADVPAKELKLFLRKAKEIMTQRIPELWKWIIVPLEVEAEVAPAGDSWFKKEKVAI